MQNTSSNRFNANAKNYASSEVHVASPTISRLHELLPPVTSVCDVAAGAGHTGLSFAGKATRLVAVDPAVKMLEAVRMLAADRNVQVELVPSFAESISLESNSFDLVVCRLAAHHFTDIAKAMQEMTRIAKPDGYVAIIDMEGDENPDLDALNHDIEVLHDPSHVRSYTAVRWRELFRTNHLDILAEERRCREIEGGLTVKRWCELGNSGEAALQSIEQRLASAPPDWLSSLEITRDADGGFRIPVRTILLVGKKSHNYFHRPGGT